MTDVGMASATERRWPVVIIGAGPAGVAAAISAARDGARVLLVDRARFPRPKACGGCINPKALRRMEALGVADVLDKIGASTIDRLEVRARRARERSAVLRTGAGRAASRRALDAAMLDQARRTDGVNVLTETSATIEPRSEVTPASKKSERRVALRASHGETGEVRAGVVIAADGLRGSSLRKLDGFDVHVKPGSRMGVGRVFDRGPTWIEPA